MTKTIAVILGDGIGPEIVDQALRVLDRIAELYGHTFNYIDVDMGGCAIDKYGDPLPESELKKCVESDSVLLGAVGGNKWNDVPGHMRPEKGLLRLRAGMGVYSNNRPAKIWPQLADASPLKKDIVEKGIDGISCTVITKKDTYCLEIPSPGGYMIYPASMAVAIGEHLGMQKADIIAGVAAYVSTGSRMRRIRLAEDRLVIDDCYNANPQAMSEALRILAKSRNRKLAILGDMGELGDLTPAAHRAAGELAAQLQLDAVVAIGPKSADIAVGGGELVQHFLTIEEAMPTIHMLFAPGTTVLVKASHAMEFGKIVKELEETYK